MRKLCLVLSVVFVIIIGTSPVTYAGEKYQKDGFTIALPGDWEEIPRDVIDAYEEGLAEINPDAARLHYDYGFQFAETENWFEHPYVLVQVNNKGRIPETQIDKLEELSPQEVLDKEKKGYSSVMNDIKAGEMYFDKDLQVIWMRIELDVVDVGHVSGLSGLVPTRKGFIAVHAYSLQEDFPANEAVFRNIVDSVKPEPGLEY